MKKLLAIALFSVLMLVGGSVARADGTFTFTALPASGTVNGAPGSTVGWGYSITNDSSTQWLVTADLTTTGSFQNGTPNTGIFDFPIIAPDTTVNVSYNAATGTGLFAFTWNSTAPIGFTNSGQFDLTGFFCADSMFDGCSTNNIDVLAPYSTTATSSTTPEPTPLLLLSIGVGLFVLTKKRPA